VGRNQPYIARTNSELRTQTAEVRLRIKVFGWLAGLFTVYSVICVVMSWLRRNLFNDDEIAAMRRMGYDPTIDKDNSFANFGDWLRSHTNWALPIIIVSFIALTGYVIYQSFSTRKRALN
jgi:hypothetical protein